MADDQVGATEEKSRLEEAQRAGARERKAAEEEWIPRLFELDAVTEQEGFLVSHLVNRSNRLHGLVKFN